jgi:acetyl esterase/lipase
MKNMILSVVAVLGLSVMAGERQPIWPSVEQIPDFQDHQIGAMNDEIGREGFVAAQHRMPYLEWFEPPANPNGACMILVSGGSYVSCCDVGLIKDVFRKRFTELGYVCVNLVYRTPRAKGKPCYWSAWQDGQRAVRLVRAAAEKRGFDAERIGAIGMSAGGHLVTLLATSALTPAYAKIDAIDDLPCHINLAVCNAPAYNTQTAAAGVARPEDGTLILDTLKVNDCFKFDAKTCPISFHHGGMDPYTPNGSTLCYRELRKRKIPSELHLYADYGHGAFGLERAVEFMRQMNFDGKLAPAVERRIYTGEYTQAAQRTNLWDGVAMPYKFPVHTNAPYMTWYVPKKLTTKAIQVVFPGGGYYHCNAKGEGAPIAEYLNSKGMTVVVVIYRTPRAPKDAVAKHTVAWADAQRAIRLVRAEAPMRGLDPNRIGAMGFSAGGHLTLMTALSSTYRAYKPVDDIDRKVSCRVNWACPIYPAYALTDGVDAPNKNGGNDDDSVPVPEFLFDINTPAMCFMHGDADGWAAMNSVKIWERLRRMGVQCDLHTLAKRGHCFQFKASPETGSYTWLDRIWEFMSRKRINR